MPKDYQYVPLPPEFRTTRPVGPVRDQRSEAARLEALLATRDRLAQQTPTERLLAGMNWTPGPRIGAAPAPQPPTVTLASLTGRESPPDEVSFGLNPRQWIEEKVFTPAVSGVGSLIGALDRPPTGYPADTPYTSPLRIASSAFATMPAAAGTVYDALAGRRTDAPVVDPMRPSEEQAMFSGEVARRGGGRIAQGFGTVADLLVGPEHGLQLLGAAAPVLMGAGKLATVAKEAQAARALTGGFYSRVDEAAKFLPAKGVKAESLINTLKKASGGVSAEELELRRLAEFAASKRGQVVTPADLAAHLKANPAPFPKVKTLREEKDNVIQWLERNPYFHGGIPQSPDEWLEVSSRLEAQAQKLQRQGRNAESTRLFDLAGDAELHAEGVSTITGSTDGQPKFSKYQVPGGENYRETLLTLPKKSAGAVPPVTGSVRKLEAGERGFPGFESRLDGNPQSLPIQGPMPDIFINEDDAIADAAKRASYQTELKQLQADRAIRYSSPHFDDPNVLAHTRSNERTSPTGERGTFLEEVQSDWHQKGKEKGYQDPSTVAAMREAEQNLTVARKRRADEYEKLRDMSDLLGQSQSRQRSPELEQQLLRWKEASKLQDEADDIYRAAGGRTGGVPDAPFKENWPDLSLKQALIDEANRSPDPGFLGFTGGKTQAARYDLSKQVGKVEADLYDIAGDNNWRLKAWDNDGNQLPISNQYLTDTELADHIGKDMARKIIGDKGGVYTGLDLQVGGEGMHEFYDKLLPKRLEKIVKPFGGTVEAGDVATGQFKSNIGRGTTGPTGPESAPMWLSRLTPEMKARILKEGLPLMGLSGLTLGSLLRTEKQQAR